MIASNDKIVFKVHNLVHKSTQYCKHVNSQDAPGGGRRDFPPSRMSLKYKYYITWNRNVEKPSSVGSKLTPANFRSSSELLINLETLISPGIFISTTRWDILNYIGHARAVNRYLINSILDFVLREYQNLQRKSNEGRKKNSGTQIQKL